MGRNSTDGLVDDRQPVPRALENITYVVGANQAASLSNYPPFSWPGGSMIVDFDGRILAQADPGPGAKIVVAPIDITALRHERSTRVGHHMPAHLRTEAYPVYRKTYFAPGQWTEETNLDIQKTTQAIRDAQGRLEWEK